MRAQIEWQGGLRFKGSVDSRGLVLDGDSREGCSPMETLMMALAGCMAIDIVHILGKMHGSLRAVRARIEGQRTEAGAPLRSRGEKPPGEPGRAGNSPFA